MQEKGIPSAKTIWAYAYEIHPPQPENRLCRIKALLDHEHSDAKLKAQIWNGRFVEEKLITHILVVSDTPAQGREVNRKLEAELKELKAGFSLTAPMSVTDDRASR